MQEMGGLDGVLSFSEMAMPLVARLAERLGSARGQHLLPAIATSAGKLR